MQKELHDPKEQNEIRQQNVDLLKYNKASNNYSTIGCKPVLIKNNSEDKTIEGMIPISFGKISFKSKYYLVRDKSKPPENIEFLCTECNIIQKRTKTSSSNMLRHIRRFHPEFICSTNEKVERTDQQIFAHALSYILLKTRPFSDFENNDLQYIMNIPVKYVNFTEILDDIDKRMNEHIIKKLSEFSNIAIMADEWTDLAKRRYLAIVASVISENEFLHFTLAHTYLDNEKLPVKY